MLVFVIVMGSYFSAFLSQVIFKQVNSLTCLEKWHPQRTGFKTLLLGYFSALFLKLQCLCESLEGFLLFVCFLVFFFLIGKKQIY